MTDEAALQSAVLAAWDSDLPRLVYADWLDEHPRTTPCPDCQTGYISERAKNLEPWTRVGRHDPRNRRYECPTCAGSRLVDDNAVRAEFIRLQCELARLPACWVTESKLCTCTWHSARARETEILNTRASTWSAPILAANSRYASDPESAIFCWQFARGFLHVSGPLSAWFGGPCVTCRGSGINEFRYSAVEAPEFCPLCIKGHIAGLGPAVVRAYPVARMTITDCNALRRLGDGPRFRWWMPHPRSNRTVETSSYTIPRPIFDLLKGQHKEWSDVVPDNWCWEYDTAAAAHADLSTAAILWAMGEDRP